MPAATAARPTARDLNFPHARHREPLAALCLTGLSVATLVSILGTNLSVVLPALRESALPLVFWSFITIVVDLFPVPIGALWLTLDLPVLLAVAFIFPPPVAALLAAVAAVDRREFNGTIGVARALFNRSQIALSIYLASLTFEWLGGDLANWTSAVAPALAAVVVDYGVNAVLVGFHSTLVAEGGASLKGMTERLRIVVGLPVVFVLLGFGFASLSIASLYREAGPWAVLAFIVPTLVARQFLVKNQELESSTLELERQERLVEQSLSRLVDERADERLRIAGELHDDVLQSLVRVHMLALVVRENTVPDDDLSRDTEDLVVATRNAMALMRSAIAELRASPIARGGLVQAITGLAGQTERDWGVKVDVVADHLSSDIKPHVQVAAYQVLREGLLNAVKHAQPRLIRIAARSDESRVVVEVTDDGVGFDPGVAGSDHFGLHFMKERTARLGGALRIDTEKGKGTTLYAEFSL